MLRQIRYLAAGAVILAMAACGSGGGDAAPPVGQQPPPAATTGTVALLLTDAPTHEFCRIYATIEAIDLLGTNGPSRVFEGPETVDILALRNFTDVFAIAPDVPVGTYEKIRLTLSDLALVRCDGDMPVPESEWIHPNLPGNGKLDLNPRGEFQVIGGETLIIEIDLDMTKSLHIVQAGNSGRWQFRPVIFVTISPDDTKLVRVFGEVRAIDGTRFELCPAASPASTGDGGMDGAPESRRCLDVATAGDTGIFGEDGLPAGLGGVGDPLTAIGFLSSYNTGGGSSRSMRLLLDAVVIELGPIDAFERIAGEVATAPGSNDILEFLPDGAAAGIDVLLQSGTRIFSIGSREELTSAALQPGTAGEVDGVFADPATDGEPLRAALLVLEEGASAPQLALFDREVQETEESVPTTDPASGTITLKPLDPDAAIDCVKTTEATRLLRITQTPTSSETEEIFFGDLAADDMVDVYGSGPGTDGCAIADTVQVFVDGAT